MGLNIVLFYESTSEQFSGSLASLTMDGDFNSELSVTRFDIVMFIVFVFDNYLNCIKIYSCNRSFSLSTASPSFLWRRMAIQKNAF